MKPDLPGAERADAGARSIMVVDDTPANLDLLADLLSGRGYKVRTVPNGRLALTAAQKEPPDLILLDVAMPDMDGYELCARLKAIEALRQVPVIFLSARSETPDLVKGFEAGGVDYVPKPFQAKELEARIHTHLELRRLHARVEESYARLRELERLRDDLIHMVAHDMRTPLGVIRMALELVTQNIGASLDRRNAKHLESALRSSLHLAALVDDLLDVSRLESGQMPLEIREGDVQRTVESVVSGLGPAMRGRTVEVRGGPASAPHDRVVVARVVGNVLTNALKFTGESGRVEIDVTGDESGALVAVRDYGPGVPEELRDKVFEKFWRSANASDPNLPSIGLGLAFCRLAVHAHGGEIGVRPASGGGSVFWFTIPRRSARAL